MIAHTYYVEVIITDTSDHIGWLSRSRIEDILY
jgi:hypothetical protein